MYLGQKPDNQKPCRNPGLLNWIKTVVLMLNSDLVLAIKLTEYTVVTEKATSYSVKVRHCHLSCRSLSL